MYINSIEFSNLLLVEVKDKQNKNLTFELFKDWGIFLIDFWLNNNKYHLFYFCSA